MGIFEGILIFWNTRKERQFDTAIAMASSYDGYSFAGNLLGTFIGKILLFCLYLVFGVVLTLVDIVKLSIYLFRVVKNYKFYKNEEKELISNGL